MYHFLSIRQFSPECIWQSGSSSTYHNASPRRNEHRELIKPPSSRISKEYWPQHRYPSYFVWRSSTNLLTHAQSVVASRIRCQDNVKTQIRAVAFATVGFPSPSMGLLTTGVGLSGMPQDWLTAWTGSNTGKNGLITAVITTTASGQTATGTYELDTINQYASLRQHITITTTITPSATASGDSGLQTVAVVVLAGGVAWLLAGRR